MSTLRECLVFATTTGRAVFEVGGDSTAEHDGNGHAQGLGCALTNLAPCAGTLLPFNHNSPDGSSNNTHGYWACKHNDNGGIYMGVYSPQDLLTPGYDTGFKQYGPQVPLTNSWQGPLVAYLGKTTLNGAITAGSPADAGALTVVSTAEFPSSGRVHLHDGTNREIISYTGKTATTLTGIDRGNLSTTPRDWADGSTVSLCYNGIGAGATQFRYHPLGSSVAITHATWYMSLSASSINGATMQPMIYSLTTDASSDTSTTTQATGSATNMTGAAVGAISRMNLALAAAARDELALKFGPSASNGIGPFGPAALLYHGLFATERPCGVIQAMGISQGMKRLNQHMRDLRTYHAASGIVEYDKGFISRFKVYLDTAHADNGGNGTAGVFVVRCWSHNEASGGNLTALVDSAEPWTIYLRPTLNGAINASAATITLSSTAGMQPAGSILIGTERIEYAAISSNDLTGCTRGVFGTVAASHSNGDQVYVGYPCHHPLGLCTDLLFEYNLLRSLWVTAGGDADYFWYWWVRPIPVSAAPAFISQHSGVSGNDQKEGRLIEYLAAVNTYLAFRPGFVPCDHSQCWTGGESTDLQYGDTTSDVVHNNRAGYIKSWNQLLGRECYAPETLRAR